MKKKVYLDRQPRVGDTVEAISGRNRGDQIVGYQYTVVRLRYNYIVVTGERIPAHKNEIIITDGYYEVIDYVDVPEPIETHVKVYKFLGIPFGKRTTYIYD